MLTSRQRFIQQPEIFIATIRLIANFLSAIAIIGVKASGASANIPKVRPIFASIPVPTPQTTPKTTSQNSGRKKPQSTPMAMMNSLELSTHTLVNKYRQSLNLPPLMVDPSITAQAQAHSWKMARLGAMSHDGFDKRKSSVAKIIVYRSVAENVAYNLGHPQPDRAAIESWIGSPGHQRNMLGRYDLTGIGVAKNAKGEYFFTQIFIRKA